MATIVEYTDRKVPRNRYPRRIVSPSHSSPCCFSDMEELGGAATAPLPCADDSSNRGQPPSRGRRAAGAAHPGGRTQPAA